MGGSSKIWSSCFRHSNRFLKGKSNSQFKNPNAEDKAVLPTYILPQNFTVSHWFYWGSLGFFKFKRVNLTKTNFSKCSQDQRFGFYSFSQGKISSKARPPTYTFCFSNIECRYVFLLIVIAYQTGKNKNNQLWQVSATISFHSLLQAEFSKVFNTDFSIGVFKWHFHKEGFQPAQNSRTGYKKADTLWCSFNWNQTRQINTWTKIGYGSRNKFSFYFIYRVRTIN